MSGAADLRRRRLRWLRLRRSQKTASTMTMLEHLSELRRRLTVSLLAFLMISAVAFVFYDRLLDFIRGPLCDVPPEMLGAQGCALVFRRVFGGFLFRLKLTALAGLVVAAPVWLYQIWAFVTPGLTVKEKRYAIPFGVMSLLLFAAGGVVAYLSLPLGIKILLDLAGEGLSPLLEAEEYLNFVGLMFLGFGVTFELPLILFFLGLAGVVTVEQLRRQRKAAVVVILVLSAIVTPSQDPYTMMILAVPLYLLYELTILILRLIMRRRAKRAVSV